MICGSALKKTVLPRALVASLVPVAVAFGVLGLQANSSARLVIEVINRHFTVGRKIRSVYLRVYSDGMAECHMEKYWDEPDVVKRKMLGPADLQQLQAVLDGPELLRVKKNYGLMAPVIDSWMEWDIRVPHGWHTEEIRVLNFSPASARNGNQAYPPAVLKLGCSIWKIRNEVYGDAPDGGEPFYRVEDCKRALEIH